MIPPCDPAILENNPQFKRLYQNLTTDLLNPDASTCANDAQPARKAVCEANSRPLALKELKNCRTRHAKQQIKKQTLRELAFDHDNELPDEIRDTIIIISLYLDSSPSQLALDDDDHDGADALSLLAPDIDTFYSELPTLIPHFSTALSSALRDLRLIANAGDPSSSQSTEFSRPCTSARQAMMRVPVSLSSQLEDRLRNLRQKQLSELPAVRFRMAATAAEVLATRAAVLERTVMLLERAKHGALARATKAKAEHLLTVAQGVEGKLKYVWLQWLDLRLIRVYKGFETNSDSVTKLDVSASINKPETVAALGRYRQHLRETREQLGERQAAALEELKVYMLDSGASDRSNSRELSESGHMKGIARRYGALIQDIEDVRLEMERLDM
ncbi:hypothetical protein BBP40_006209 [Aspergillus hancockii]|nr:hypothetical protein BBP40_006209 [Aspergillus hancockii]